MKKLLALGVIAVLGLVADFTAKSYAEGQLETRAAAAAGDKASVTADISSFPFLGRLLLSGAAGDVRVDVEEIAGQALELSELAIELRGVQLDKAKLIGDRKVELTDIDQGTITASVSAGALSRALRVPIEIADGRVRATIRGRAVEATPMMSTEGTLRLEAQGLPALSVSLTRTGLLACTMSNVRATDGKLELSCTVKEIPPALLRAVA